MKMNNEYMTFEICGTLYKLSEYDEAIKKNQATIPYCYEELKEFPYTVRSLTNTNLEKIKEAPLFILYRNLKISFMIF